LHFADDPNVVLAGLEASGPYTRTSIKVTADNERVQVKIWVDETFRCPFEKSNLPRPKVMIKTLATMREWIARLTPEQYTDILGLIRCACQDALTTWQRFCAHELLSQNGRQRLEHQGEFPAPADLVVDSDNAISESLLGQGKQAKRRAPNASWRRVSTQVCWKMNEKDNDVLDDLPAAVYRYAVTEARARARQTKRKHDAELDKTNTDIENEERAVRRRKVLAAAQVLTLLQVRSNCQRADQHTHMCVCLRTPTTEQLRVKSLG
jgi:hypothetical protein